MLKFSVALLSCLTAIAAASPQLIAKERALHMSVHSFDFDNMDWKEHLSSRKTPVGIDFDVVLKQVYTNPETREIGIFGSQLLWFKIDTQEFNLNDPKIKTAVSRCETEAFGAFSKSFNWKNKEALVAGKNLKVIDAIYEIRGLRLQKGKRQDFGVCLSVWFIDLDGTKHVARAATWVVSFLEKKARIDVIPISKEVVNLFKHGSVWTRVEPDYLFPTGPETIQQPSK